MKIFTTCTFFFVSAIFSITAGKLTSLDSFDWNDCGIGDPTTIEYIDVSPYPLELPGTIYISLNASATLDVDSPAQLNLEVQRRILDDWVDLPCSSHFGTCSYDDFCFFINVVYPPTQPCPDQFIDHGVPCQCPITAEYYYIADFPITLNINLPAIIVDGDYHMKMNISSQGVEITCFEFWTTFHIIR